MGGEEKQSTNQASQKQNKMIQPTQIIEDVGNVIEALNKEPVQSGNVVALILKLGQDVEKSALNSEWSIIKQFAMFQVTSFAEQDRKEVKEEIEDAISSCEQQIEALSPEKLQLFAQIREELAKYKFGTDKDAQGKKLAFENGVKAFDGILDPVVNPGEHLSKNNVWDRGLLPGNTFSFAQISDEKAKQDFLDKEAKQQGISPQWLLDHGKLAVLKLLTGENYFFAYDEDGNAKWFPGISSTQLNKFKDNSAEVWKEVKSLGAYRSSSNAQLDAIKAEIGRLVSGEHPKIEVDILLSGEHPKREVDILRNLNSREEKTLVEFIQPEDLQKLIRGNLTELKEYRQQLDNNINKIVADLETNRQNPKVRQEQLSGLKEIYKIVDRWVNFAEKENVSKEKHTAAQIVADATQIQKNSISVPEWCKKLVQSIMNVVTKVFGKHSKEKQQIDTGTTNKQPKVTQHSEQMLQKVVPPMGTNNPTPTPTSTPAA